MAQTGGPYIMDNLAIAQEAFITHNFSLAGDEFKSEMTVNGPSVACMMGLADSLARSGNITRAWECYSRAYRLGNVQPKQLEHLVTGLVDQVVDANSIEGTKDAGARTLRPCGIFACDLCKSFWIDPITLLCGHTFCRNCVEKHKSKDCKTCGKPDGRRVKQAKTNVLLQSCLKQWFPREIETIELKEEGNRLAREKQYTKATDFYSMALSNAPNDHLILSNRSQVYNSLGQYEEALQDAHRVIALQPDWSKGYFRKGQALEKLDRQEEAAQAYLQCLKLEPKTQATRQQLAKVLHNLLSPLGQFDFSKASSFQHPDFCKAASYQHSGSHPGSLSKILHSSVQHEPIQPRYSPDSLCQKNCRSVHSVTDMSSGYTSGMDLMGGANLDFMGGGGMDLMGGGMGASNMDFMSGGNMDFMGGGMGGGSMDLMGGFSSMSRKRRLSDNSCISDDAEDTIRFLGSSTSWEPSQQSKKQHLINEQDNAETNNILAGSSTWVPAKRSAGAKRKSCEESPHAVLLQVSGDVLDPDEWNCPLCMRLLYEPVTTPCGHVFCRSCLNRTLDHNSVCPLCKTSLVEYLAERHQAVTESVKQIIESYFPDDHAERKQIHDDEMEEITKMGLDGHDIPVFVCTIAYPQLQCPLHVFEPRYRLMVRQCMEAGTRQFGMSVTFNTESNFAGYGTMLEIRDLKYFPDGRAVLDCVGDRRFRVLSRGTRDGYNTAKVEFIEDFPIPESEKDGVRQLHDAVYVQAQRWFETLPSHQRARLIETLDTFPELETCPLSCVNGPKWTWWLLASLPLDQRAQIIVLGMQSLSDRLRALQRVLNYHITMSAQRS